MVYSCSFDVLVDVLSKTNISRAARLRASARTVQHGMLSVGLKIHVLPAALHAFTVFAQELGHTSLAELQALNVYKKADAPVCIVLPPVGSANTAIELVRLIESTVGIPIFGNTAVQIQACTPGRISAHRMMLFATSFYLGSRVLRSYKLQDLRTSISKDVRYMRGMRLVIYDGYIERGDFDSRFEYWDNRPEQTSPPLIVREFPFPKGRSDVLIGVTDPLDIENINLVGTLLVHAEFGGFWSDLGQCFESDMISLLQRHQLAEVASAPWTVQPEDAHILNEELLAEDDQRFSDALSLLVQCALGECERFRKNPDASPGILQDMQHLLWNYRMELTRQSELIYKGGVA